MILNILNIIIYNFVYYETCLYFVVNQNLYFFKCGHPGGWVGVKLCGRLWTMGGGGRGRHVVYMIPDRHARAWPRPSASREQRYLAYKAPRPNMGAENWNFLKLLKTIIVGDLLFCLGLLSQF